MGDTRTCLSIIFIELFDRWYTHTKDISLHTVLDSVMAGKNRAESEENCDGHSFLTDFATYGLRKTFCGYFILCLPYL